MAKKENIVLENIELKPQVIGMVKKKKSNIGRVIFIMVVFILAVYYINDISLYINNLLGKKSAVTIEEIQKDEKSKKNKTKEESLYKIDTNLVVVVNNLSITNFESNNNIVTFDIYNYSDNEATFVNNYLYFVTYDENKNIVENIKINVDVVGVNSKESTSVNIGKSYTYFDIIYK